MRYSNVLDLLIVTGIAVLLFVISARAQLTQSGAGMKAGGGGTPCAAGSADFSQDCNTFVAANFPIWPTLVP